jgi:hypothetical protein
MEQINISGYVLDFERIKELTDNGLVTVDDESPFKTKKYSTVNSMIIDKMLREFFTFLQQEKTIKYPLPTNFEIMVKTLIHNKILIKPRVSKIEKLLKDNE